MSKSSGSEKKSSGDAGDPENQADSEESETFSSYTDIPGRIKARIEDRKESSSFLDRTDPGHKYVSQQFLNARAILERRGPSGVSLYSHLQHLYKRAQEEEPEDFVEFFEEYSYELRRSQHLLTNQEFDVRFYEPFKSPNRLHFSKRILEVIEEVEEPFGLRSASVIDQVSFEEENNKGLLTVDIPKQMSLLEEAGIFVPYFDRVKLEIAIGKLVNHNPVVKLRFWGIIYGTNKNYYITEAELTEQENLRRNSEEYSNFQIGDFEPHKSNTFIPPLVTVSMMPTGAHPLSKEDLESLQREDEEGKELQATEEEVKGEEKAPEEPLSKLDMYVMPPLPTVLEPPLIEVPKEDYGHGVNKCVYYVCNNLGDNWIRLPDVTPQQIVAARQIIHYFSGNLETPIENTFPRFPGNEKNYLRAQIARITAGTHISPNGWYAVGPVGEEDYMEEDAGGEQNVQVNPFYEPLPLNELLSPANWVHHSQYLLTQGRTTWWSPEKVGDEGAEEVGEEENEEEEPEKGPDMLTPIKEDARLAGRRPWTLRSSCALMPDLSFAILQSLLWPGAYAISNGKLFDVAYIGWGMKVRHPSFSPARVRGILTEYELGPEIMEILDPTPEQEEAWRLAHLPPQPPVGDMGEEVGEGGEGDVEDDEEEDEDD